MEVKGQIKRIFFFHVHGREIFLDNKSSVKTLITIEDTMQALPFVYIKIKDPNRRDLNLKCDDFFSS